MRGSHITRLACKDITGGQGLPLISGGKLRVQVGILVS